MYYFLKQTQQYIVPALLGSVGEGCPVATIHQIADNIYSRKPLFTLSVAYTLGPVLRADYSPEKRFRPAILLHVWMDMHS